MRNRVRCVLHCGLLRRARGQDHFKPREGEELHGANKPVRHLHGGASHQHGDSGAPHHAEQQYSAVWPQHLCRGREEDYGFRASPLLPDSRLRRQVCRCREPQKPLKSAPEAGHSGGPQRVHADRGRHGAGGHSRDHRSPQNRQSGDRQPGLLPERAGRLYEYHYLYDHAGEEPDTAEGNRGTHALGNSLGHSDVPLADLHGAGPRGRRGARNHRRSRYRELREPDV